MQMATAIPRWRLNHLEVSAASGANVAALPRNPINNPCAMLNCHNEPEALAAMKPPPSPSAPMSTGIITPKRSASRPMNTPPSPKPIMAAEYGSDASPRAMPNSACMSGSTTLTV